MLFQKPRLTYDVRATLDFAKNIPLLLVRTMRATRLRSIATVNRLACSEFNFNAAAGTKTLNEKEHGFTCSLFKSIL